EGSTFGDDKEFDVEDDVEWVEAAEKGDVEGVEATGKGDVKGVKAFKEGSTVGEDNDNGFESSFGHENVTDFATSVGKDNVNAIVNAKKESDAMLDENEIEVGTRMNMKAWLGQMKMKNVKMFLNNEPKRVVVKCIASPNCPWRILASYTLVAKCLQIKTFQDEHHCSLREIQRICASEMHVNVSIDYFYKAKKIMKEKMAGNSKKEFGMLWDYAQELRSRMPLIGLDGCFLKGPFKSEFLATVRRDTNNLMFFITWAMVKVECIDSWVWFLSLLSVDLGLEDGYGYTIISDQQKGLEIVIFEILLRVEHRNCARHMFVNWSKRKLGKSFKFNFWQIMKSITEREWEELCVALEKKDKDSYENLMRKSQKM
ncbi:hypothetical protein Goshw_025033, partial [Gossypium schwendimanii]|nr:hypothetical protein [Gossypium schwendimanii]